MSLLRSSLIVSLLSLFGSVISFVNQLVIAHLFGTSVYMDAYLMASSIPMLVSGNIASVLSYSMVPTLISHRNSGAAYRQFYSMVLFVLVGVSLLIIAAGYIASPWMISILGAGLSEKVSGEAVLMTRVSWITSGIAIILAYLATLHNAGKHFYLPVIVGLFPYLGMIVSCFILGKSAGPVAIAWGMLSGTLLAAMLLFKGAACNFTISRDVLSHLGETKKFFYETPLVIAAMGCFTIYQSIDSFWAPGLGTGNLAYLGYCQRLLIALGNLVIAGPSVVLVPRLTEACVDGRVEDFLVDLGRAIKMVLIFAIPVAVTISVLATPVIELLFQRGAFDTKATSGVASVLPLMMAGMVAMLCVVIIFRGLYASRQIWSTAILGGGSMIMYFALSGVLSHAMGVKGIALAYVLTWWITFGGAVAIVWRGSPWLERIEGLRRYLFQLCIIAATTGSAVYGGAKLLIIPLAESGLVSLAVRICATSLLGATMFLLLTISIFRNRDVQLIVDSIIGKFTSKRC